MNYRHLLFNLIKKDYILKYRNTSLGFLWAILEPLSTTIILYAIFSFFVKFQIKYYFLFLFNGLILWQFFSTTLLQGTNIFLNNSSIIKKLFFPYFLLYISPLLINLIQYLISLIILIILSLILLKIHITLLTFLFISITIILFLFFLIGIIMITSILHTKYRDLSYFISIILKFWFYVTPIIYPLSIIPAKFKNLFYLNPMFPYTSILQNLLFYSSILNIKKLLFLATSFALLFFITGYIIYKKNYRTLAEEV